MWRHVRAILVTLHLVAITLMAVPAPDGFMDRSLWQDPSFQKELTDWSASLNRWGVNASPKQLEERLWRTATVYMDVRGTVLRPFQPYYEYCGTNQSWRMFSAPVRYPVKMHIEITKEGTDLEAARWRTIYIDQHGGYRWRSGILDSYRFRPARFWLYMPGYGPAFRRFGKWAARHVRHDFPDAEKVRLRLYKYRTPSPEEVRRGFEPEGEFFRTVVLSLKETP